jgi:hypothetical protein
MGTVVRLPRTLATFALAILVASVVLLIAGFSESNARQDSNRGITSLPYDGPYVRSILDGRVDDRFNELNTAAWALRAAGRPEEAEALFRFFADCNTQRLITNDGACRDETVRGAIAKGRVLNPRFDESWPVPSAIEPAVTRALSFRLPDEALLRASTSENSWRSRRFDSPGVLRYSNPEGAHLFVAAQNGSSWVIARFQAQLVLDLEGGSTVELSCDSDNPFPFATRAIAPQEQTTAYCRPPDGAPLEALIAAFRALPDDGAPPVRVAQFELHNPYVRIVSGGDPSAPEFTVAPLRAVWHEARNQETMLREARLPRELAALDCAQRGDCRSRFGSIALEWSELFFAHLAVVPIWFGALLGVILGGFVRSSLKVGAALSIALVAAAAVGAVWLFSSASSGGGDNGFALMGAGAIIFGGGFVLVFALPAFFAALLLMRLFRD